MSMVEAANRIPLDDETLRMIHLLGPGLAMSLTAGYAEPTPEGGHRLTKAGWEYVNGSHRV